MQHFLFDVIPSKFHDLRKDHLESTKAYNVVMVQTPLSSKLSKRHLRLRTSSPPKMHSSGTSLAGLSK